MHSSGASGCTNKELRSVPINGKFTTFLYEEKIQKYFHCSLINKRSRSYTSAA